MKYVSLDLKHIIINLILPEKFKLEGQVSENSYDFLI